MSAAVRRGSLVAAGVVLLVVPPAASAQGSGAVEGAQGPVEARVSRIEARITRLAANITSTDGAVTQVGIQGRDFRLNSDVLFDFDRWNLKPRAVKEITRIAVQLKAQATGEDPVRQVAVTGHTDAKGGDTYNVNLSNKRAASVRALLQQQLGAGITVTAAGKGETEPIADNTTDRGRKQNRRVEIKAS